MREVAELRNAIKNIVSSMLSQMGQPRHAVVMSVDPVNALVKVSYDEDNSAVSGWLPIAQVAAGANWTAVCLPLTGTQVFVAPDMGDIEHGVVLGSVHSTQQPAGQIIPYKATAGVPLVPGEFTVMHSSGVSLRLTDGAVEVHGLLRVDGDLLVSGNVTDLNGIHGSLDDLRQVYDQHQHGGVQSGGGLTGMTNKPTP